MPIDPTRSPGIQPGKAERLADPASEGRGRATERTLGDTVEISAEGHTLAQSGEVERVPFTEARAAEVRQRLESGFYDDPDVVRSIAERLIDSGDL
jgi:anti-sigma28 factor (negative regulator of flagellin synthesis)